MQVTRRERPHGDFSWVPTANSKETCNDLARQQFGAVTACVIFMEMHCYGGGCYEDITPPTEPVLYARYVTAMNVLPCRCASCYSARLRSKTTSILALHQFLAYVKKYPPTTPADYRHLAAQYLDSAVNFGPFR